MRSFEDKIAVVTGAASGIGLEITRQLLSQGAQVIGSDINADSLAKVTEELGSAFYAVQSDAGKVEDIKALFDLVETKFGKLDILVNNAGIGGNKTVEQIEEPEYDLLMNIMLKGPVFHLKYAAALLRKSDDGNVVNISSASSRLSMPNYCPYALAKAAIEKFTEDCVIQVPGVRHNAILPGFIDTPILASAYDDVDGIKQQVGVATPVGRVGKTEDIANLTLFLASDKASFINGSCVLIDGGLSRLNKFN